MIHQKIQSFTLMISGKSGEMQQPFTLVLHRLPKRLSGKTAVHTKILASASL